MCALVAFREFSRVSTLDRVHACGKSALIFSYSVAAQILSINALVPTQVPIPSTYSTLAYVLQRIPSLLPAKGTAYVLLQNHVPHDVQKQQIRHIPVSVCAFCWMSKLCVCVCVCVCACACALCTSAICSIVKQFVQQIVNEKKRNPSTQVRNRPPGVKPSPQNSICDPSIIYL